MKVLGPDIPENIFLFFGVVWVGFQISKKTCFYKGKSRERKNMQNGRPHIAAHVFLLGMAVLRRKNLDQHPYLRWCRIMVTFDSGGSWFVPLSLFVLKIDVMAMVPKSQRPELLMSVGPVPELPGVPDKLQLVTLGELGFWEDENDIHQREVSVSSSLWCFYYMELWESLFCGISSLEDVIVIHCHPWLFDLCSVCRRVKSDAEWEARGPGSWFVAYTDTRYWYRR